MLPLLFLSTFGYVSFIATRSSFRWGQSPFIFCCFIVLFLYYFALFDFLIFGAYAALCLGLILLLIYLLSKKLSFEFFKNNFLVILLIAFPFIIFYISISSDFKFLLWDEFSFWASSQRLIFETDQLFKEDSPIFFKSYPPSQQLFQYYFTKIFFWSEKNILYAQIFWILSALLCVSSSLINNPLRSSIIFLISCTFLYFFQYSFSTIYSDALLSVCFAAAVALAYSQKPLFINTILFSIVISTLLLIKEIGIIIALVTFSIFCTSRLIFSYQSNSSYRNSLLSLFIPSLSILMFVGLTFKSWSWYTASINAPRVLVLPSLSIFTEPSFQPRFSNTLNEFITRISKPGYLSIFENKFTLGPSLTALLLSVIVLSFVLIVRSPSTQRPKISATLVILFFGFFGYLIALLYSYLFVFTEYEGIRLASFERYLSSYLLAWFLILFSFSSELFFKIYNKKSITFLLCFFILFSYLIPKNFINDVKSIHSSGHDFELYEDINKFALKIKPHLNSSDKVFFIAQNSNGLERVMFYYAMLPYATSMSWCWSLGNKYFEGDVWTCDSDLADMLNGFSYIAIYRADTQFWSKVGNLFDPQTIGDTRGLYKINRTNNSISSITKVN